MAMAGMVGTAAGLKTAPNPEYGSIPHAHLLYGRRASRSGGERVVATLKLKGATNRDFSEN